MISLFNLSTSIGIECSGKDQLTLHLFTQLTNYEIIKVKLKEDSRLLGKVMIFNEL